MKSAFTVVALKNVGIRPRSNRWEAGRDGKHVS